MPTTPDIRSTLAAIDARIAELQTTRSTLATVFGLAARPTSRRVAAPARRKLTTAQKQAIGRRMKAYWAKRRAGK